MAKLNAAKRKKLPKSDFAVPGRKYPVPDKNHARNALARVAQHGSPKEKAEVKAKVKAKFPSIGMGKKATKSKHAHAGKGGMREAKGHDAIGSHEGYSMAMGKGKK